MNTIILIMHITIASALTVSTAVVASAAFQRRPTWALTPMLITFVATIFSGIGLLFTTGSIGRVCVTMATASLVVGVVNYFYKTRLVSQTV